MSDRVQKFEDLKVWKEAMRLTVEIYREMQECKDFGFKDQIQRAAVSVPSNIAEGYERQSNKEFMQYLFIAKGSCGEMRTQLYLAIELDYLGKETGKTLLDKTHKISAMLFKLIKTRKENF